MSYVGDIRGVEDLLERLEGCSGYQEYLLKEVRSRDWEQFESAFAVAQEAYRLLQQSCEVEFGPTVIVDGKEKHPNFRSKLSAQWIYFELKCSSMFPSEKDFLKIANDIQRACDNVVGDFKCIVQIYSDQFSEKHIPQLQAWLGRELQKCQDVLGLIYPVTSTLEVDGTPTAKATIVGWLNRVVQQGPNENRLVPDADHIIVLMCYVPTDNGQAPFTAGRTPSGEVFLVMGRELEEFLIDLALQVFEVNSEEAPEIGFYLWNFLSDAVVLGNLVLGRNPPYDPHKRIQKRIDDAWSQLPEGQPNIIALYSRQVIVEPEDIRVATLELFKRPAYSKISAVLYDVEMAPGDRRRDLLVNRHAQCPLEKDELGILGF